MLKEKELIKYNSKLLLSNLTAARIIIKMLLKELMNIEVDENEISFHNSKIIGEENTDHKNEYTMNASFDVGKKYVIEIEMQNFLIENRKNTFTKLLDYFTKLFTLYEIQINHRLETVYIGIILANCEINKNDFVESYLIANEEGKDIIDLHRFYAIDFTKIEKCDNIVLREFAKVLTSDASYKYKGDNKLIEKV